MSDKTTKKNKAHTDIFSDAPADSVTSPLADPGGATDVRDPFADVNPAPATSADKTQAAINAGVDPFSASAPAQTAPEASYTPFADAPAQSGGSIDFAALRAAHAAQHDASTPASYSNAPVTDAEAASGDGDFFIDMAKADERLKPMVPGSRLVVACSHAEAKLSGNGNPMIQIRVRVERVLIAVPSVDPNFNTDTATWAKRVMRENMMFIPENPVTGSKGTIWRSNLTMRAFGVQPDHGQYRTKAAFMEMLARQAELMIGNVAECEIGIDDGTNNGTQPAQIDAATGEPYPPKNVVSRFYPYNAAPALTARKDTDLPF